MPQTCPEATGAIELAELLQLTGRWLAADPATLAPSFLAHTGHPAYGLHALRTDLDRVTFLPGGTDGQDLFGQHRHQARRGRDTAPAKP